MALECVGVGSKSFITDTMAGKTLSVSFSPQSCSMFSEFAAHTLVMCTTVESATATLPALDSSWQFFLEVYPYLDLYPMVEVPLFIINQPVVSTRTAFLHHPLLLTSLEIYWFALWAQGTPNLALFLISVSSIRNYRFLLL